MAQRVTTIVVDDIDGSEGATPVSFALDGVNYEIDLNDDNSSALRSALKPFIAKARRTGGTKRGRTKKDTATAPKQSPGPSAQEIRTWARENGHEVSEKGRIPATVREAYDARPTELRRVS